MTYHETHYTPVVKRIAQVGLMGKGVVYSIFGILILMATFGTGTSPVKLFSIIKYIISFGWYGRGVVLLLTVALLCYSVWKLLQMVLNTEGYEKNFNGYFVRITWIGPFFFYLALGAHSAWQLYKYYSGTFDYDAGEFGLKKYLFTPHGKWVIAAVAVSLFGNAVSLFYLAFTGNYTTMLTGKRFHNYAPKGAKLLGFTGYFFYGLALLIVSLLFGFSIYYTDSSLANGSESMFDFFIGYWYGPLLLSAIAFGTIGYGIYFITASFYRWRQEE